MVYKRILLLTSLVLLSDILPAQIRCGTTEHTQALYDKLGIQPRPDLFEQWLSRRRESGLEQQRTAETSYRVPVVVHIIHKGEIEGIGTNISDEQIFSQIKVLNDDFKRLNADASQTPSEFASLAGSIDIQFVLARIDPQGNPTDGIVRKTGSRTFYSDSHDALLKAESFWPSEDYLNIWVCNLPGLLGYAQFPVSDLEGLEEFQGEIAATDGVVVHYQAFGSDDDGDFDLDGPFNKGRTLTHEVGHYFGLRHIWGDDFGCGGTDYVDDTPNQAEDTNGCPSHPQISCVSVTMFQNYMDYSYDACMNLFTVGQAERMTTVLENSIRRVTLLSSPGLGDEEVTRNLALRSIKSPTLVACADDTQLKIRFQNLSTETIEAVRLMYSVDNETPVTSDHAVSLESFEYGEITLPVTLPEGNHSLNVSIDLANGETDVNPGDNSLEQELVINSSTESVPARERFEADFSNRWSVVNPAGGASWEPASTNYATSLVFEATNEDALETSWLVSPLLDLANASQANLRFDWSHPASETGTLSLKLMYSIDCGLSYETLTTIPMFSTMSSPVPTQDDEWESRVVSLASLLGSRDARLAFVASAHLDNPLYLDNIELYNGAASPKIPIEETVAIYPTDGGMLLTFNVDELQSVGIEVYDMRGQRMLTDVQADTFNQTYLLFTQGLPSGIYVIRIHADGRYISRKVFLPGQ